MKVFRDIFAAIMLGLMGGFVITLISYYNHHKEGGIFNTLFAMVDSFGTVAEAYADGESTWYTDLQDYDIEGEVLQAFEMVEAGEADNLSSAMLTSLLQGDGISEEEQDILAMEGVDGAIDEGAPYSGILRFHVRANSDSDEDQELKLAVKEDVVALIKPLLADCHTVAESKNVIVSHLQDIYEAAINTMVEQGYDYSVNVYVTEEEFPAKTYGDLTFPQGRYQALRVDIGKAEGQNWWCVMFPPLCFIDESTAVVSEEGKKILQENLTPEEYEDLFASSEIKGDSLIGTWFRKHFVK